MPNVFNTGRIKALIIAIASLALVGAGAIQPVEPDLPFESGEVLSYTAVSGRFGTIGTGTMRVDGPESIRGSAALRLSFDFSGRVGPFRVEDHTRSWITRDGMSSLRYQKNERSPLGSHEESVEIYPDEGRWQAATGESGETASLGPLDELSFIYHLRSLPLRPGDRYTIRRHFDPDRNPVYISVIRRERTKVPAGEFTTIVVEMRVRDARLSEKESMMRFYLTDDDARIPVRMESSAPWVGSMNLMLQKAGGGR